jgi:hypothetical protein
MSHGFLGGTRGNIKVMTPAKVFKGAGWGGLGIGALMDVNAVLLPEGDPNKISVWKAGLNFGIGAGTMAIPVTAPIGIGYSLIDAQWGGDWGQFFRDSADGWKSILGRSSPKSCTKGSKK